MSTALPSTPPPMWGERTSLLDKDLRYMFSMDLEFVLRRNSLGSLKAGLLAALTAPPEKERGRTFHVFDEVLGRTGDGLVVDVPFGEVKRANDRVLVCDGGVASLDGRVLLDVEGPLSIAYSGVATFPEGAASAFAAALQPENADTRDGSAFVSLRSECERPKYRWMVENQLFGFGTVVVTPTPAVAACRLSFSYDIYWAG